MMGGLTACVVLAVLLALLLASGVTGLVEIAVLLVIAALGIRVLSRNTVMFFSNQ